MWVFIPWDAKSVKKAIKAAVEETRSFYATQLASIKLSKVTEPNFPKELAAMEQKLVPTSYKFGVLYCRDHQTSENEMFSNGDSV
jgi:hypothetical protein